MQENNLYGKRMRTTYQKIYQDRYDFHPKLIEYEKKKIEKNIKEMALEISDLKNFLVQYRSRALLYLITHHNQ